MATEKGVVTKLESTAAWVTTTRTGACESCSAKHCCRMLGEGKEMEVAAVNTAGARVGDTVVIGIETSSIMKLSFLLYIVPIVSMIIGAVIGQKIAVFYQYDESISAAIVAFLFFFFTFFLVKSKGNKLAEKNEYRPKIIRILKRQ